MVLVDTDGGREGMEGSDGDVEIVEREGIGGTVVVTGGRDGMLGDEDGDGDSEGIGATVVVPGGLDGMSGGFEGNEGGASDDGVEGEEGASDGG